MIDTQLEANSVKNDTLEIACKKTWRRGVLNIRFPQFFF